MQLNVDKLTIKIKEVVEEALQEVESEINKLIKEVKDKQDRLIRFGSINVGWRDNEVIDMIFAMNKHHVFWSREIIRPDWIKSVTDSKMLALRRFEEQLASGKIDQHDLVGSQYENYKKEDFMDIIDRNIDVFNRLKDK